MSALETNIAEDLGFRLHHLSPGIGTEVRDTFLTGAVKSACEFKPASVFVDTANFNLGSFLA